MIYNVITLIINVIMIVCTIAWISAHWSQLGWLGVLTCVTVLALLGGMLYLTIIEGLEELER